MPANHPLSGKQKPQQQKQSHQGVAPALAGATPLSAPPPAAAARPAGADRGPQYVFVNGQIWTANPQVIHMMQQLLVAVLLKLHHRPTAAELAVARMASLH